MIVSVTEVATFKRCRRQWDFGSFNRQGLTPIIQPKPYLDLGTLVHKSLAYWTTHPDADLVTIFEAISAKHYSETVDKYVAATGYNPSDELLEPLMDAVIMARAMMTNYQLYYGQPLPSHLSFASPEQELLIPIPGTEEVCSSCNGTGSQLDYTSNNCGECDGTGAVNHMLKARLDVLLQDKRGNIYVGERKTYNARPNLDLLEKSDQFIGYVWAAQQLNIGPVVGLAYDGLWKRAAPPQRPKKLDISDLFCRTIIKPFQSEIDEYGQELARVVKDMADPKLEVYKNRVWQGCWDCSFEHLCTSQSRGDDYQSIIELEYTRRTEDDLSDIEQQVEGAA